MLVEVSAIEPEPVPSLGTDIEAFELLLFCIIRDGKSLSSEMRLFPCKQKIDP